MDGNLFMFMLIILCSHNGLVWTQDYYYEDDVDHGCGSTEHFCFSTDRCNKASEVCDGQCGVDYYFCPSSGSCLKNSEVCDGRCGVDHHFCHHFCMKSSEPCDGQCGGFYRGGFYRFCPSNGSCLHDSEACDGQCGFDYHFNTSSGTCIYCEKLWTNFCPSTNTCIDEAFTACDGNCHFDYPNLCDNRTRCYANTSINNHVYECMDRSDEHRPTEEPPPLVISSVDKFLQLNTRVDVAGDPGVDCQDGTVYGYNAWCIEEFSKICGGVSTTDYFICHNSSLWKDRPCSGYVRGCKVPGKCIAEYFICDGYAGDYINECGASDYSDEVCPVNEYNLKEHTRYFRCKDNLSLIHPTLVCDGFKHCGDLSDENECEICPRVNNMVVHGQEVQLMAQEIRDFAHLKNTAIMKCESPYGQYMCATPGDGVPECSWQLKEGLWQTQDEVELTSATLWRTIFKYMSYIFLVSLVVLFKITQLGYFCQKSAVTIPILTSYRRMILLNDEPLPLAIPMRSLIASESFFPTPFFTKMEPVKLSHQFRQYYIHNHRSERFEELFNVCLTLSQFLSTRMERDTFHCGIYALEAQIHGMSPTCTDRCLKQHSSGALEPMFDAVYGAISDRFPNKVKDVLFSKDKLLWLNYLWRFKTFILRYFFFYYDIVQEYVLLSFIVGTAGLGISTTTWLEISNVDYIHIVVYLYTISAFLPMILFAIEIAFSSHIGIIFGLKNPSFRQNIFFGFCCFIMFPFIPTVLFFRMEKKQIEMFKCARSSSKALNRLNNDDDANHDFVSLKHKIVTATKILRDTNSEITKAKSLYKQFKEWELAIEMPIQSSLTVIFSFMKKSTTVVNQVFQNWFISDTKSLILLIGMSLRSIIAVQISDESARRNNFLGIKSKLFLAPLYMTTSIPRIASFVIYVAIPLGLMDLLGHWTVERQGNTFSRSSINVSLLAECNKDIGYNHLEIDLNLQTYSSNLFSADVTATKYTTWNIPTYMAILLAVLSASVIINFVWLCSRSKKCLSKKILSSAKSVLCITLDSDFDEDDESIRPDQLHLHYKRKFDMVHKEYILKLLFHTGTNMALTFPWALAYKAVNERHQILTAIGDCYGGKGTLEMEDISLERLWWGQWIIPLAMAVLGVLNYGWFRLYVKYGHPWRRLLTLDRERIEEWRTLKLWEMLENQNDNVGEVEYGNNLNMPEAISRMSIDNLGRDVVISKDVIINQEDDAVNREEESQEDRFNVENKVDEDLGGEELELDVHSHKGKQDDAINK